jgi:hypothetical protein
MIHATGSTMSRLLKLCFDSLLLPEMQMKLSKVRRIGNRGIKGSQGFGPPRLILAAVAALALALTLSSCENVATNTQSTLVRVIDASYVAPAVNIYVEGTELAANVGEGIISEYGALPASAAAPVIVTPATATSLSASNALVASEAALLTGQHYSVFLTDNAASPTSYALTVLQDQKLAAANGNSAFRFINQAIKTGAVDIYMVPGSATLANLAGALPLESDLAIGTASSYISFASQTVTMVIVPAGTVFPATGTTTIKYSSTPLTLTGGEVRTVVIVDSQLTSNPPVSVVIADDAD